MPIYNHCFYIPYISPPDKVNLTVTSYGTTILFNGMTLSEMYANQILDVNGQRIDSIIQRTVNPAEHQAAITTTTSILTGNEYQVGIYPNVQNYICDPTLYDVTQISNNFVIQPQIYFKRQLKNKRNVDWTESFLTNWPNQTDATTANQVCTFTQLKQYYNTLTSAYYPLITKINELRDPQYPSYLNLNIEDDRIFIVQLNTAFVSNDNLINANDNDYYKCLIALPKIQSTQQRISIYVTSIQANGVSDIELIYVDDPISNYPSPITNYWQIEPISDIANCIANTSTFDNLYHLDRWSYLGLRPVSDTVTSANIILIVSIDINE